MERISFLKKKSNPKTSTSEYLFDGEKMEIYIPSNYFDPSSGLATVMGSKINSFGTFMFKVYGNKNDNLGVLYSMNAPLDVKFSFSNVSTSTTKLTSDLPEESYRVFTLHKGDVFMDSDVYIKSGMSVFTFIAKLVHGGKMPATVKYSDALVMYLDSLRLHGIGLGVPSVILELVLSELYRSKKDTTRPFRLDYTKDKPFDYKMVRITKIPEMVSTFTGIASDDINHKIAVGVLRNKEGKKDMKSPIEKVLKY